jgi:hypothetical protein
MKKKLRRLLNKLALWLHKKTKRTYKRQNVKSFVGETEIK